MVYIPNYEQILGEEYVKKHSIILSPFKRLTEKEFHTLTMQEKIGYLVTTHKAELSNTKEIRKNELEKVVTLLIKTMIIVFGVALVIPEVLNSYNFPLPDWAGLPYSITVLIIGAIIFLRQSISSFRIVSVLNRVKQVQEDMFYSNLSSLHISF